MRLSHIFAISSAIAVQANAIVPAQGVVSTMVVEESGPFTTHVVPGNSTANPTHPTAGFTNVTGKTFEASRAVAEHIANVVL